MHCKYVSKNAKCLCKMYENDAGAGFFMLILLKFCIIDR